MPGLKKACWANKKTRKYASHQSHGGKTGVRLGNFKKKRFPNLKNRTETGVALIISKKTVSELEKQNRNWCRTYNFQPNYPMYFAPKYI